MYRTAHTNRFYLATFRLQTYPPCGCVVIHYLKQVARGGGALWCQAPTHRRLCSECVALRRMRAWHVHCACCIGCVVRAWHVHCACCIGYVVQRACVASHACLALAGGWSPLAPGRARLRDGSVPVGWLTKNCFLDRPALMPCFVGALHNGCSMHASRRFICATRLQGGRNHTEYKCGCSRSCSLRRSRVRLSSRQW
jgi:hypothetical protein